MKICMFVTHLLYNSSILMTSTVFLRCGSGNGGGVIVGYSNVGWDM